ncbi:protein of unknown function [Acidithiobacillus ferrivorans]|uniref:Uncharacterized protein n=1 Tax=Acidithiobacillus ferrivorans TaxID=160808 RepID=A0A060UR44_9PROT|nr:hypothetical protein AFERRI_500013 [Acidithiobacillus ferrivorans]SMH65830.1 protein of unknown function [Acidithiobacillus ferrivorans]
MRGGLSDMLNQNDGMGSNAFTPTGVAQLLGSSRFDIDRIKLHGEVSSNIGAHLRDVRCQFGTLTDDGRVHITHRKTFSLNQLVAMPEQEPGICARETDVGVGKMATDVAQGSRPQQGIADGVKEHIGIGVAGQAEFVGDRHTAENKGSTRHQRMHVKAMANTQLHGVILLHHAPRERRQPARDHPAG